MKRLFAYGCSFTNYIWPMWPVLLTKNFDQVHNRGKAGAGNEYIFHTILQDLIRFNINREDTIFIMWSGYGRFDICRNHKHWETNGNVYANDNYELAEKYWSLDGSIVKTYIYINTLIRFLENLEIKFKFFDAFGLFHENIEVSGNYYANWGMIVPQYLRNFDRKKYFSGKTLQHYLTKPDPSYTKRWEGSVKVDGHPSVKTTIDYMLNEIQPYIDFEISKDALSMGLEIHQQILNVSPYDHAWCKDFDRIFNLTDLFIYDENTLETYLNFYQTIQNS